MFFKKGGRSLESSKGIYEKRKKGYKSLLNKQRTTINFISALRLIIFAAGAAFSVYFYIYKKYYFSGSLFLITMVAFFILVLKHSQVIKSRQLTSALYEVNEAAVKRINGEWKNFADDGGEFANIEHSYSDDLDIFGKSSLFQWINTAATIMGREKLKNLLAFPELNSSIIIKRQQGIDELAKKISFRQRLNAEGQLIPTDKLEIKALLNWSISRVEFVNKVYFRVALIVLPFISCGSIIYYFVNRETGYSVPLLAIAMNIIALKMGEKVRNEVLETSYDYKNSIRAYAKMIALIESYNFKSEILKEMQCGLTSKTGVSATASINKLVKVVDKIQDRRNFFSIVFNILFLWDYRLISYLEKWKKNFGGNLEVWFEVIGEFEALSSLAVINFDNKTWAVPKFNDNMTINARELAHPLLPVNRVSNSINLGKESSVLLITGSNMSGKSTFLRTIGINLVLAYAGVRVCGESFTCPLMNIYTCMRISDNLEQSISSFYAEILRIKKIVTAVKTGQPIFFLLDEIFKGTNSIDRHLGAETLINKLSKENAIGLVSTHDLELGELEDTNDKVKNYHFQENYKNNEIHFDYKIRPGVSTTRNAIYLMKMAGIEF
jgi:DNA mismatch repair ATPase MutS